MRPFSLHNVQLLKPVLSLKHLWLPSQSMQTKNPCPPHVSHVSSSAGGRLSMYFLSSPLSWRQSTSSAPPMYLPSMKTLGSINFDFSVRPKILWSSSVNRASIDRSRSSIGTRNARRIDRTDLQSSNVDRTTRKLVK